MRVRWRGNERVLHSNLAKKIIINYYKLKVPLDNLLPKD